MITENYLQVFDAYGLDFILSIGSCPNQLCGGGLTGSVHLRWVIKGSCSLENEETRWDNSSRLQGALVAQLFSAVLGLVIKVPHCCYVLLSAPILPSFFGGNFKIKWEDGDRQQQIATVIDFYHPTFAWNKEPIDRGYLPKSICSLFSAFHRSRWISVSWVSWKL